jgi:hypothetical protein
MWGRLVAPKFFATGFVGPNAQGPGRRIACRETCHDVVVYFCLTHSVTAQWFRLFVARIVRYHG